MEKSISTTIEDRTRPYIDGVLFSSSSEVLLFSLDLLVSFEAFYSNKLGANLASVAEQMQQGQCKSLLSQDELKTHLEEICELAAGHDCHDE